MIHPKFRGNVKDGQIFFRDAVSFKKYLLNFKRNTEVSVTVKEYEQYTHDPLRKFYFKVMMALLADDTGHSKEDCHHFMKMKFSTTEINGIEIMESVFSKESNLPNSRKIEFVGEVKQWMLDFRNIIIPEKDDVDYE